MRSEAAVGAIRKGNTEIGPAGPEEVAEANLLRRNPHRPSGSCWQKEEMV